MAQHTEVARVSLGTPAGEFDVLAFQCGSGSVYLALVKGEIGGGRSVLTRLHSECLTGDALGLLAGLGVRSLLVEGGSRVITSFLSEGCVDRLVVGIAPTILGAGTDAVGDLRVEHVAQGVRLVNGTVYRAGDDVLVAADVNRTASAAAPAESLEACDAGIA